MPRRHSNARQEKWKTPGSKGKGGRAKGRGSYSKNHKASRAKRYERISRVDVKHPGTESKRRQRRKKR